MNRPIGAALCAALALSLAACDEEEVQAVCTSVRGTLQDVSDYSTKTGIKIATAAADSAVATYCVPGAQFSKTTALLTLFDAGRKVTFQLIEAKKKRPDVVMPVSLQRAIRMSRP